MAAIEITKAHVGKTVFAIPTGNNARRQVDQQELERFEIVGFGRKYAKVLRYGREVGIDPKSGAWHDSIKSGYGTNAGYIFFDSEDAAIEHQLETKLRHDAYKLLSSYSAISRLSMETIRQIIKELSQQEPACQKS